MAQNNISGSQPPQPSSAQQSGPIIGNNIEGNTNNGEKVTKKKRKRCGECQGCLKKDNCNECGPCKSVRSHQICKMRKCDQLKTKKEKTREVSKKSIHFFIQLFFENFILNLTSRQMISKSRLLP